jgi:hypothetical protein
LMGMLSTLFDIHRFLRFRCDRCLRKNVSLTTIWKWMFA